MYDTVIHTLPEGYVPHEQWPEYHLESLPPPGFYSGTTGKNPRGIRWGVWPLFFERYVSDTEPVLADSDPTHTAPPRFVVWNRILRTDTPRGWFRATLRPNRLDGFAILHPQQAYTSSWSESARRYRKKWLSAHHNRTHTLRPATYAEFEQGYLQSSVVKTLHQASLHVLKRMLAIPTNTIELWVVENTQTKEIISGMSIINSPTCRSSYYLSGFVSTTERDTPGMIALMDRWYSASQAAGMRYLLFGEFWIPGKPKNWKGFSSFKSKFGLHYIQYPPLLVRFVKRKSS
jgi:hypothetical protein